MSDVAAVDRAAGVELQLEPYRAQLTGYCYRMLGSAFEAEDAVQETMVRAWRGLDRFEGRSALRSWLYRIATNVCLDMLGGSKRRARPMDLTSPATPFPATLAERPEATWIGPVPDGQVLPDGGDPAEVAAQRDAVRLAFIAALQHLAPRQRAVLILREVLAWKASEVAELLGTTVASVNSALQRARATLAASEISDSDPVRPLDPGQRALLARYVDAFERYDLDSLTALLHEDATLSMPPYELWLRGREDIRQWLLGHGIGCRGSRLVPTVANGMPAFGQYRPGGADGCYEPWALQVLEISGGRITGLNSFLDTERLFPLFGLPARLGPRGAA
ncbi:sigma-70 family RNA polymerase sigma factor [Streptomyces hygroscopicus subsp. hygroscopicus]|uniref:DNA-directed RNA polymerase sigma-70 factor n=1 Tax=Streptomyces hygroscopicus TaxID=1912 RepID=A0ABQ3UCI8_STRHY|nr:MULTISPECIES: sigma-70 family RNA polymerase sigma factor [Streptomyces]MBW8091549.1 sigma-70 family RNA polymerase sigma factor [Streptomyces hygroscopicus subsp. hygroscopicus]MCO8303097.1 sigma-70 family RNA polymerase sigma factor [Streptomyces sp. RKCA744]GHJ33268.1 DNA-directed RNA polymerase sigma-70 factor [Streptomyces hygroscopicus]